MSPREATITKYTPEEKEFFSNNWLIKESHKFCLPQILILLLSDNIIFLRSFYGLWILLRSGGKSG